MAYTFDKSLETGHSLIDSQHKELIAAINNLMEACNQGKGREETKNTIAFLKSYTNKHFGDEEALQRRADCRDRRGHRPVRLPQPVERHDGHRTRAAGGGSGRAHHRAGGVGAGQARMRASDRVQGSRAWAG